MTLKTLSGGISYLIQDLFASHGNTPEQFLLDMARASLYDRDLDAGAAGLTLERWMRTHSISEVNQPRTNRRILVVCAALAELFAERAGQEPPSWTAQVGGFDEPFYFFPLARENAGFRAELERQTPEPLRCRNLYATKNYLKHV